ncbi:MAG: efflux transporter outer membrane subunit [Comamonadaceae bacterium]|nr:MAG: efflux transporter outer membrane subunit [Comamonadaceae bacterium]
MLAGCAINPPPSAVDPGAPAQFYAPVPANLSAGAATATLPHNGSLAALSDWWSRQDDPLLVELIAAGQAASPTVSAALSGIEQARFTRVAAGASLLPSLDGTASATRSRAAPFAGISSPPTDTAQLGLQTSWEIDIFGRGRAQRDADEERLRGARAQWHDARVSVAAEVANQYYALRACNALLDVSRADAFSRSETSRLTELAMKAGFEAPATAALARASAAESRNRLTQQAAQCDIDTKALVALTALPEPEIRQKLAQSPVGPQPQAMAAVPAVPAAVLAQRPDVFNAAREVAAASQEVGSAQAERYPRLTLGGSITTGKTRISGSTASFDTWSIGPLALKVPLLDGGAAAANTAAAVARYDNAASQYRATARQAVREVEEALVNLQSTADRSGDASLAADGYRASFTGTEARYRAGLASLVELEDARRTLLNSQSAVVSLERERRGAWIALYRALGGGWTPDAPTPDPRTDTAMTTSPR